MRQKHDGENDRMGQKHDGEYGRMGQKHDGEDERMVMMMIGGVRNMMRLGSRDEDLLNAKRKYASSASADDKGVLHRAGERRQFLKDVPHCSRWGSFI
ncbi:hypothetical protein CEXT_450781 [Caerostris extrusa]|uniref:Uncharacterized protein n=1 Tax=Caerostris extrusa TaxID=172846 RepID=A0AAV4WJ61_CAEEX|nr:hypothetical protein CEXT_450781 [Caerostris extrusa]